ncbi:MAG: hypothetical protein H7061_10555 [Bdellovibrionaceae bacterium]|nr:hypothetical protein [Bdellovibrio sp.]
MKKLFELKTRANPGDGCPNGAPVPCTPSCTKENGVCVACARCPIGQGQASSDSCTCSTIAKDPPINNTFLCPDSKTMVTNINDCPLYECTTTVPPIKVQKPSNCPMVAPSNAPNTNPPVNRSR